MSHRYEQPLYKQPNFRVRLRSRFAGPGGGAFLSQTPGALMAYTFGQGSVAANDGSGSEFSDVVPGWGNALPRGAQFHRNGGSTTPGTLPTQAMTPAGWALKFNGSNNGMRTEFFVGDYIERPAIYLVQCIFLSASGDVNILAGSNGSFGITDYGNGLVLHGGVIKAKSVQGGDGKIVSSGITPTVGRIYNIACRTGVDGALYVNGQGFFGDLGSSYAYYLALGGTGQFDDQNAFQLNGYVTLAYVASKLPLSNAELSSLTINPWQIFCRSSVRRMRAPQLFASLGQFDQAMRLEAWF